MSAWLIFFFGGVIGFCFGIISLILIIAIGESEMCLEKFDIKNQ
jgi:hypothetical protein